MSVNTDVCRALCEPQMLAPVPVGKRPADSPNERVLVRPPLTSGCAAVWHLYPPASGELGALPGFRMKRF